MTRLFRAHFKKIQPYIAVESPNQLTDQSGIAYGDIIKLNANENPYGPSPAVQEALARYNGYQIYPDSDQRQWRAALQGYTGLDESNIIVGAGADELIDLLLRATLEIGDAVIDCPPTFGMYAFSTQVNAGLRRRRTIRKDDIPRQIPDHGFKTRFLKVWCVDAITNWSP